jgi:hypothetical protein
MSSNIEGEARDRRKEISVEDPVWCGSIGKPKGGQQVYQAREDGQQNR